MNRPEPHKNLNAPNPLGWMLFGRQMTVFLVASSIVTASLGEAALAQMLDTTARPVRGQIAISRDVTISPSVDKVNLNLRDAEVADVLQMLAKQGKFNLILDSGVQGTLTVDVTNVSINKALEYIFNLMDLSYVKDGNTVIVAKKSTIDGKNMAVKTLKTVPVQYKSAVNIANQLNNTIFKIPRAGGSSQALAAADPDSNSLLIMGTETDIKLVGDALRELDVPRNRKVYHIHHNNPYDVANVLAANFFRNNQSVTINGGNGSSSSGSSASSGANGSNGSNGSSSNGSSSGSSNGGSSSNGSSSGTNGSSGSSGSSNGSSSSSSNGSSSNGSSSGGSGSSGSSGTATMGISVSSFSSDGVTFISEPVSSTLTVLGTEEQIALIDSVIDQVDVQRAQVAIEVALVEIQNSDQKSFVPTLPNFRFGTGLVSLSPLSGGVNTFTIKNPFTSKGLSLPTNVAFGNQTTITHSNTNLRNKVLANPTVVAIDGQSSSINISDTLASITYATTVTTNGTQTTPIVTQQQAGVTVSLTPKIYNDGSVVLTALTPTVTQPSGKLNIPANGSTPASSIALLSTRSMTLSGVRVKDGETLVIGGLLKESSQLNINKVPGLDKMPILGAMFRAINQNDKDKTELVLMVTPHLLKEDNVSYFKNANTGKFSNLNYGNGGIVPVNLPKFTGEMSKEMSKQVSKQQQPDAVESAPTVPLVPASSALPETGKKTAATPSREKSASAPADAQKAAFRIEISPSTAAKGKTGAVNAGPPNGGMAALMLARPEPGVPVAPSAAGANATTVYRSPALSSPPSLNPMGILDEILK